MREIFIVSTVFSTKLSPKLSLSAKKELFAVENKEVILSIWSSHGNKNSPGYIACYYTFSSLTLFWLAESLKWIFEISARDVKTCRLYNNHVKVTSNHIMYDRGAWFLKVIMSSSRALCCLALAKKKKKLLQFFFRSMYNKTIIRFGFCDIQNNRGLGKGYQPQPTASADNPYLDLDYSGYHKNLIQ